MKTKKKRISPAGHPQNRQPDRGGITKHLSTHNTFDTFLWCIKNQTRREFFSKRQNLKEEPRPHFLIGVSIPTEAELALDKAPNFREFGAVEGVEPLKEIWDNLPEFKDKGKGAIQAFLAEGFKGTFPEYDTEFIAKAIYHCLWRHIQEVESDESRAWDNQREPGSKGTPEKAQEVKALPPPNLQKATENEEEEQREKQPSDGQEHQFVPRQWDQGERGKAAAIVLSCSRSKVRGKRKAPYLDSAKVICASKNPEISTNTRWVERDPQGFSRYIYNLKIFGEECEETTGVPVPDDYFRRYGK